MLLKIMITRHSLREKIHWFCNHYRKEKVLWQQKCPFKTFKDFWGYILQIWKEIRDSRKRFERFRSFWRIIEILIYEFVRKEPKIWFASFESPQKKFQIQDLKKFCGNILFNEITNNNAIETLIIANNNCILGLKEKAIDHIQVNHPIVCKGSHDKWRQFVKEYPELVLEIVDEIARKSILISCELEFKYKTRIIKKKITKWIVKS